MPNLTIADATPEHLDAIAAIYAEVVRTSPATFDIEPPSIDRWRELLGSTDPDAGHHLIVALDDDGWVLGYAKSGPFMERAAYNSTCLTSVYVAADGRGRGVGTALYARLFELLDASPLRLATAGITEPNEASTALHRAFGFELVGTFDGVGVKFGRPWSVTWYQRPLV
ncbi:MAG: GNAT family N-acetyltransferase [Solirubrobacterales bacterium]